MMIKRLLVIIFLVTWSLPGISTAKLVDRIVAKVNGDIITLMDLESQIYSMMNPNIKNNKKEMRKIFLREKKNVLNKMIEAKLMLHYAKMQKIEVSNDAIDKAIEDVKRNHHLTDDSLKISLEREGMTMEEYRSRIKDQITLSTVVSRELKNRIKVNEKEVADYYKKNKKDFLNQKEIKVKHILFLLNDEGNITEAARQKKKAQHVLDLAKRGSDFEELAKKYSEGPSKDSGGNLGWITKGTMIDSFEKAAFSSDIGIVDNIVTTQYGYHVVKVEDIKRTKMKTIKEKRSEIEEILFKQKYEKKFDSWIAELKKNSYLEIYLDKNPYAKRQKSTTKNGKKIRKIKTTIAKGNNESINSKEKIKISKFILGWENALETKNRQRYFSYYSKYFKTGGLNREEWKELKEKEYDKYKFISIEIRNLRVFKRNNFYIAAFDQRVKSNIDDQIRMVRLYLKKHKKGFKIAQEKWLHSSSSNKEFSKKPLLSSNTLPKTSPKLSKKTKSSIDILPQALSK